MVTLLQQKVKRRGRRFSDLRFAKRTPHGYAFFEKSHNMWDILHETVTEALRKNPHYELSFIVELCSELVNTDESELSSFGLPF